MRAVMANIYWLEESAEVYEGDNVQRRVEQVMKGKHKKKQLLSVAVSQFSFCSEIRLFSQNVSDRLIKVFSSCGNKISRVRCCNHDTKILETGVIQIFLLLFSYNEKSIS